MVISAVEKNKAEWNESEGWAQTLRNKGASVWILRKTRQSVQSEQGTEAGIGLVCVRTSLGYSRARGKAAGDAVSRKLGRAGPCGPLRPLAFPQNKVRSLRMVSSKETCSDLWFKRIIGCYVEHTFGVGRRESKNQGDLPGLVQNCLHSLLKMHTSGEVCFFRWDHRDIL